MAASGVCRSDHHSVHGIHRHAMPIVLGHEGSAVVEDARGGRHRCRSPATTSSARGCRTAARAAGAPPAVRSVCERLEVFDERVPGRRDDPLLERRDADPPQRAVLVRRALGGAGEHGLPGRPVPAARAGRAPGLRGHDRRRRGAEHREGAPRRLGARDRVRRRRALGDPGRADRRRLADRRGGRRGVQARARQGARRDRDGARGARPGPRRVRPRDRVPRAHRDDRTGDARRRARRDDRPGRDGRRPARARRSTRSGRRPRSSRSWVRGTGASCRRATCRCSRT